MKSEDLTIVIIIVIIMITPFATAIIGTMIDYKYNTRKTEYTKQLEQSLQEQIQEKQVYINILERSSNGD